VAVLGVDACKQGWIGLQLGVDLTVRAHCSSTIEGLVALAGPVSVVAIDIPIGLPELGARQADELARRAVGARSSSVFNTPPRAAIEASTYEEAAALCRELCGKGLSKQSYALAPKILEIDAWLHRTDIRVVEVHPEVSFATLAGTPLRDPKSSWAGFVLRRQLLADVGIDLAGDLGLSGQRVGPDDVLDAAVAAWTAARVGRNEHVTIPDPPEIGIDGGVTAIYA
jgi:predicted RNase H-like nuclease